MNMQTPKGRTVSVEVPQRTSPSTAKTARKLKTSGPDVDSVSSPNPASRTPKDRSPKVIGRRSPRSPAMEQKRPGRMSGLEDRLAQLQEEVKAAKEQLSLSESLKKTSQQEADEIKKQLAAMSEKLEESEKQLLERSDFEEARLLELRKISQDRDREWKSELEAVQKQQESDSAALASALNEIQKLKLQLDRVADSEATQTRHAESANAETECLRVQLKETLILLEQLRNQLNESKESEATVLEESSKAQMELEVTKMMDNTLRREGLKAMEACKSLSLELEKSKAQVVELEELVNKLQSEQCSKSTQEKGINVDADELKTERGKDEVNQLQAALENSERRYQEECIQNTLQIRSAYEILECTKSESIRRETEWNSKLNAAKADMEELKKKLMDKEAEIQKNSDENKGLKLQVEELQAADGESELLDELKKSESILADLRASLSDKEAELQSTAKANEMMKSEIKKREMENDEVLALAEASRTAEREALMKMGYLTEEADKSGRKAARVIEELNAAQATNSEMEAELRKLKVQSDQWRKAAEAAAAMLSTSNNGRYVERTGSLDYHTIGGKLRSPLSEDMDDGYSPKKKNGNMLKKIGSLLKKGHK
ncbi:interactor of constitutive active ROPs 2, chloroplastic-like [Lycium ferocissimum]|uniref:interactor of constitutive active ROPs 2, chloroplastic-like n=1 Tax=Lycium ferocissimum TaxID=112874 RepID=UPI002814EABC|nr:interactor of constitutive active ROPs 2, chloroplastic-like [Lycium ferocissimum]XP_059296352.1 interactor of constitutive active ROPs 2, chloroplastic-like [Lycium ferocissimum]XP_059296353.1 interactor of constitutive active ROPs 2, chloroplastic-like [Lycium ferocissimum]XP_059296354.1 interactor of constitutive active ROPs 2, chloroplastic-like [Lycium ferocissimum]